MLENLPSSQATPMSPEVASQAGTRPSSPLSFSFGPRKSGAEVAHACGASRLTEQRRRARHPTALKPGSIWTKLASLLFLIYFFLTSLVVGFPVCVCLWILHMFYDNKRRWLLHRWTTTWAYHYNTVNPCIHCTTLAGLHNLAMVHAGKPVIFVANHQSALDIFLLYGINAHFKWVSKSSNFNIPLIGWAMSLNDYVPVTRGRKESVVRMFDHCKRQLSNCNSIMIFPEGTRNVDGGLKPFKPGAFQLAIDTQTTIIPLVLNGTSDIFSGRSIVGFFNGGGCDLTVKALEPIDPSEFGKDVEALCSRVREAMSRGLEESCMLGLEKAA